MDMGKVEDLVHVFFSPASNIMMNRTLCPHFSDGA